MARKILYSSNTSKLRTGFGKQTRVLLSYLFTRKNADGSPKYEIVEVAHGLQDNDQRLAALPWKGRGVVPMTNGYLEKYRDQQGNLHPEVHKCVSYGAETIEEILKEEKPFLAIHCEDPWAHRTTLKGWFWENHDWFQKGHNVLWCPLDSTPLFKDTVEGVDKIPHFWVKGTFAERVLHEAGHPHVRWMPFVLDVAEYRVFGDNEKLVNRARFKIDEDALVFGFIFRNQGRKRPIVILEGLKKLKENNPGVKAKALFLTSLEEGWQIGELADRLEVSRNDVLLVNLCRACSHVSVLPLRDGPSDCQCCGKKESVLTPDFAKGVTEKELTAIYNLMDGYIQAATSGGFEAPCAEAMFMGVPAATVNYSFGETYIGSGEVFSLDYAVDWELSSNFQKAVINPDSVTEFMQKFVNDPGEMKATGLRGRDWAMQVLHPDRVCRLVEEFIDALPDNDYDWEYNTVWPNPEAEIPVEEDDEAWALKFIENFYGMRVSKDHPYFKTIMHDLGSKVSRERIHKHSLMLLKEATGEFDPKDYFEETGRKRLLYDIRGDIGDSLLSLTVLEELHRVYPDFDIYIACQPPYNHIYAHLDWVAGIIPWEPIADFRFWEGSRAAPKLVDVWITPDLDNNYIHNGVDRNQFHRGLEKD